ncbi:MAG: site-2 protease family protein, partial [Candidatus Bathyarchaeia archaeon]
SGLPMSAPHKPQPPWGVAGSPNVLERIALDRIRELAEEHFSVGGVTVEFDVPVLEIRSVEPVKEIFVRLVKRFKEHGLLPLLRRRQGRLVLIVLPMPPPRRTRRITPIALFAVTLVTVFLTGYFGSGLWVSLFGGSVFLQAGLFTVALIAIVGLHELGHKTAALRSGIQATPPYFIPGPPLPFGFGTLGAVIMQKEPPVNRDQLFDLGFSGPVTGFAVTVVVAIVAILTAQVVDESVIDEVTRGGVIFLNPPVIWGLLVELLKPLPVGMAPMTPPIGIAAWVGFVITFLNLLPVWQLDGGHVTRALFGEKGLKIASVIGLLVAFATGFWFFGLLILFFMMNAPRVIGTLDNVSPPTPMRRVIGSLAYVILALSAVLLWPM